MNNKYSDERELVKQFLKEIKPKALAQTRMTSYASDLWVPMGCLRRAYYDRLVPGDSEDERDWYLTAEHGNYVHEMVVDFLKRAGYWRGDELRGGSGELNLSFRIDCLVQFPGDAVPVPLEIKSTKRQSLRLDENGNLKYKTVNPAWDKWIQVQKRPLPEHELQLQTYLALYNREIPYEYGYLLYYNKNDDEIKLWKVAYDPDLFREMSRTLRELEDAIIEGEEPEQCDNEEMCKWCGYKTRCGK